MFSSFWISNDGYWMAGMVQAWSNNLFFFQILNWFPAAIAGSPPQKKLIP
jgi:hypothetical protein